MSFPAQNFPMVSYWTQMEKKIKFKQEIFWIMFAVDNNEKLHKGPTWSDCTSQIDLNIHWICQIWSWLICICSFFCLECLFPKKIGNFPPSCFLVFIQMYSQWDLSRLFFQNFNTHTSHLPSLLCFSSYIIHSNTLCIIIICFVLLSPQ